MVRRAVLGVVVMATVASCSAGTPTGTTPPPVTGYDVVNVAGGLTLPTNLEFAPGGRVFVTEKDGRVQTFDDVSDPTPTLSADLSDEVASFNDLGLLALAVDPSYPAAPWVYLLYTTDPSGRYGDVCPDPPGAYIDGCPMSARITRFPVDPATGVRNGPEQVLVADRWCLQFPTHSVDDLAFLPDRTLVASAGDGASFSDADIGRLGGSFLSPTPRNPCGDPPGGVGATLGAPTAEGGALRAQDVLTSSDPTGFNGAVVRISPDTGAPVASNPLVGRGAADDDAVIAHGLRNPFRLAVRPGTDEVWISDVGWNAWEELDRIGSATDGVVENFGRPCREGPTDQPAYTSLGLDLCARATAPGAPSVPTNPYFAYPHTGAPDTERCGAGGMSVSGLGFLGHGPYPAELDGALVFSDYVRGCVWAMALGADGQPDPARITTLATGRVAVDLEVGPDGYVYVLDIARGTIDRIRPDVVVPPDVVLTATPDNGPVPLAVTFDTAGSADPTGGTLTFAWDLDGDGAYDDATGPTATRTYADRGDVTVGVRATSTSGASNTASRVVHAGNSRPVLAVTAGPQGWAGGEPLSVSAIATDAEDGPLTGAQVTWTIEQHHCATATDCHTHIYQSATGTSGSVAGPDHDLPSYVVIRATAHDSTGLTTSSEVRLDPRTVTASFSTFPEGLEVGVGSTVQRTPFTRTFIAGSKRTVTAPVPQTWSGFPLGFWFWSDGGARTHDVTFSSGGSWLAAFTL